ncbi:MAG: dTDP-4-dehydrorhamnose 3,5-epimerase, partial [Actinomycetota bacterium]
MIHGVVITPLQQVADERGKVMHMLKATDAHFQEFGEIYFSCVFPEAVKAWHYHDTMVLNYAVPVGRLKVVRFDDRPESPTRGEVQV